MRVQEERGEMRTMTAPAYQAKHFDLGGLRGISDQTLALHVKLYERYIERRIG